MRKGNWKSMLVYLLTVVLIIGVLLPSGVFAGSASPEPQASNLSNVTGNNENVFTPITVSTPTVTPDVNSVYGCIKADFTSEAGNINEGFRVEIEENGQYTTTDKDGFYEIDIAGPAASEYTLKVSKENYLARTIYGLYFDGDLDVGTYAFPIDMWAGDLEPDGAVNMKDVMLAAGLFNTSSNDARFNAAADINKDNVVNMSDIMIIAKHFNTSTQNYAYRVVSGQKKINLALNQKSEILFPEGGIMGTSWRYTIDNKDILALDTVELERTNICDDIVDRKWVFKAVSEGEAIIEFKEYISEVPSGKIKKYSISVTKGVASATPIPTPTQKPEPAVVDSDSLKQTVITAHTGEKIAAGKNMIFCPTFQMAWDGLKDLLNGDIVLDGQPLLADILNKGFPYKNSISEESYLAMSGFGPETVDDINSALKEKFKDNAPEVNVDVGPSDAISFAFLFKNLKFAKTFETLSKPVTFESNGQVCNVKAFGINRNSPKYEDLSKQVEVYDYKNDDDFIVKLIPEDGQDEIILAEVVPEDTLYNTYKSVIGRMYGSYPGGLTTEDTLKIPVIDFNINRQYKELEGKLILKPAEIGVVAKAFQRIRFRLDESGAVLASEAGIVAMEPISRNLVFDAPFLVCLKQKDAENPYLLIWVDNPELLSECE